MFAERHKKTRSNIRTTITKDFKAKDWFFQNSVKELLNLSKYEITNIIQFNNLLVKQGLE